MDQLLELWSKELAALQSVYYSVEGNSMWCNFFKKRSTELVENCAICPVSNAFMERTFSVMGNVWTDERNRLAVNTVKSELCVFFNISASCTEFKDAISYNKTFVKSSVIEC